MVSKPAPIRLTMPSLGSAATTRSVIGAYCSRMPAQSRAAAITSSSVLHCAVTSSTPAAANSSRSSFRLGKLVVGEQDFGHGDDRGSIEATAGARRRRSATRNGTWPRGDWSSGLTDSDPTGRRARDYNRAPVPMHRPACPRDSAMTKLLQTTIAGSLPKPALARRAEDALGAVAPRGRRAGRGHRGRRPPRRSATRTRPGSTSSPTASRRAGIS